MKHLQKFETFSVELNENIFQDGFNAIKSKISKWKDNKIVSYFNQGLDFVKNNPNDPKVKQVVDAIGNLPENEKTKITAIINDPNGTYNKIIANAGSIQESAVSNGIGNFVIKILGLGAIFAPIVNLVLAIARTSFSTAGSLYNTPTSHMSGPTMATIFVMIGIIVGGFLLVLSSEKR